MDTELTRDELGPKQYLLLISVLPSFVALFIAIARWFDFRHHGFDILFGLGIGTVTAFFSFRYYHLPVGRGAGWAWGPRSRDKAFWAGVGSFSYATERLRPGDEEEGLGTEPAALAPKLTAESSGLNLQEPEPMDARQ